MNFKVGGPQKELKTWGQYTIGKNPMTKELLKVVFKKPSGP